MRKDIQPLRALATGYFPVLSAADYEAVHHTYGPAFGPWRPFIVAGVTFAVGGAVNDPMAALRAAARDWGVLTHDSSLDSKLFVLMPSDPTAHDIAADCPHGLLVAQGLVRLFGSVSSSKDEIPAEMPITP